MITKAKPFNRWIFCSFQFVGVNYLMKDLTPNTTYLIRVASINAAGISDWMGPKEFQTPEKAEHGTISSVSQIRQPSIGIHFMYALVVMGFWKFLQN